MSSLESGTGLHQVRRTSISQDVHKAIRRGILRSELPPGSALVEADLARRLGVSKSPVREALLRLAAEGLVEQTPYLGCVVAKLDQHDLIQIYALREHLEPLAVQWAVPRLLSTALEDGRGFLEAAENAIEHEDLVRLAEANSAFHMIFVEACGNSHLATVLGNFQDMVTLTSVASWTVSDSMKTEHKQHLEILRAAEARDADLAAERMRNHVHEFLVNYRQRFGAELDGAADSEATM